MTEQAVDMEIPTETFTHDIKKSYLQHYFFRFRVFFRTFQQLRQFRAFRCGGFVLLFFYANGSASRAGEEEMTEIRVVSRETNLMLHIETYQL